MHYPDMPFQQTESGHNYKSDYINEKMNIFIIGG